MIDKIVRRSYNEYMIVFTNRTPLTIWSSGNAFTLLRFLIDETFKGFEIEASTEE